MKYKVGDRVRIKSIDWYNENKDKTGIIRFDYANFMPEMSKYCGEILTINQVVEEFEHYLVSRCGFAWTDEMIEGLAEEESTNYYKVIDNGVSNPIIAKNSSATIDTDKGFYSYSDSDGNLEMEWNLPEGYQFKDENGNVINATKIVLEKKKKEYPKTYGECCEVLSLGEDGRLYTKGYKASLIQNFQKLIICRDAYWKIYGEEMGLGKPWEPDWEESDGGYRYCIVNISNNIALVREWLGKNYVLSFPTAEMRDAFYENFKKEIENCKELL